MKIIILSVNRPSTKTWSIQAEIGYTNYFVAQTWSGNYLIYNGKMRLMELATSVEKEIYDSILKEAGMNVDN